MGGQLLEWVGGLVLEYAGGWVIWVCRWGSGRDLDVDEQKGGALGEWAGGRGWRMCWWVGWILRWPRWQEPPWCGWAGGQGEVRGGWVGGRTDGLGRGSLERDG